MPPLRRIPRAAALTMLALVPAGCGGGHLIHATSHGAGGSRTSGAVAVIRGWAGALQRGDVRAAAGYFALPSVFANGIGSGGLIEAVHITNRAEAEQINASLSCGARLISTTAEGRYLHATFRLTNRAGAGADCGSGAGQLAATDFVIADGHIRDWIRAPVGTSTPTPTTPTPSSPATPAQI